MNERSKTIRQQVYAIQIANTAAAHYNCVSCNRLSRVWVKQKLDANIFQNEISRIVLFCFVFSFCIMLRSWGHIERRSDAKG